MRAALPLTFGEITVDLALDSAALDAAFAMRFEAYAAYRYIEPADFPHSRECDDWDQDSLHFLARDTASGRLAGYVRVILDGPRRLQVDDLFDISDYRARHRRLCEMSRLIVWPERRHAVSRALRYAATRWVEAEGFAVIVGVSREADRAEFDRRGFLPMDPYRSKPYAGTHMRPLQGQMLYGNVYDVARHAAYLASLAPAAAAG